jgi:hypothetical protein
MRGYGYLYLTVIAIFVMLLIGVYFSPTFEEQSNYLQLFFLLGALLFIFSILVIFSAIGFTSFALFLTLFISIIMIVFGIEGALLVIALTYFFWGSIFAMEILLFCNGAPSAKTWFETRYTFKTFKQEYYTFYPLMFMLYLLLEWIPHFIYRERLLTFSPSKVLEIMRELLKPE